MRPKGWVKQRNRYLKQNQPPPPYYKTRQKDYEAGADAYEKALCTKDNRLDCVDVYGLDGKEHKIRGWLIYIPDEEDNATEEAILARQAMDGDVAEQIEDLQIGGS